MDANEIYFVEWLLGEKKNAFQESFRLLFHHLEGSSRISVQKIGHCINTSINMFKNN